MSESHDEAARRLGLITTWSYHEALAIINRIAADKRIRMNPVECAESLIRCEAAGGYVTVDMIGELSEMFHD